MSRGVFKNSVFLSLAVLILFLAPPTFSISECACLFLIMSPSPQSIAMGETIGTLAFNDPMALHFNPAGLGFFTQRNSFGVSFYPSKVHWYEGVDYDAKVAAIGISLQKSLKIPLTLGFAVNRIKLNLGTSTITGEVSPDPIGTFNAYERSSGFTVAAAVDYYIRFSAGLSYKAIDSILHPKGQAHPKAHDFGFMLQVPIVDIFQKAVPSLGATRALQLYIDPGLMYSRCNIGDKVVYIDELQADPLPRLAYLGLNVSAGFRVQNAAGVTDLVSFQWAREAYDILVDRFYDGRWIYRSGMGDIRFAEHILKGKANPEAISKKGWQVGLLDLVYFRKGRYEDPQGLLCYETKGYGINILQPLKLFAVLKGEPVPNPARTLLKLRIELHRSEIEDITWYPLANAKVKSIVLRWNDIPLQF